MLESVASIVGMDKDKYIAYERTVKRESIGSFRIRDMPDSEFYPEMAQRLSILLDGGIVDGTVNVSKIFSDSELEQYRHKVDPLKLLIAAKMKTVEENPKMVREIELFKQLSNVTPYVITTNYDKMIEAFFGDSFKVFTSMDDYYNTESYNIGEIHKIHGTVLRPSSMVLTKNDYTTFKNNSNIIISKIISLLCENPLVIMGYSMNDSDVSQIIDQLFSAFSPDVAKKVSQNIIYIAYDEDVTEPISGKYEVKCASGIYLINSITVSNFVPIFEDILTIKPTLQPSTVRKIKQMMSNVVFSDSSGSKRLEYVGMKDIDDVDENKIVFAITTHEAIEPMKALLEYRVSAMVEDILNDKMRNSKEIIDIWFPNSLATDKEYIPIYHYIREYGGKGILSNERYIRFTNIKREQVKNFMQKSLESSYVNVCSKDEMKQMCDSKLKFNRYDLIAYCYMKDIVNESEAKAALVSLFKKNKDNKTQLRRATMILAFREFM